MTHQDLIDRVIAAARDVVRGHTYMSTAIDARNTLAKAVDALDAAQERAAPADVWQWWAGESDARYSVGPCATREEVIQQALVDGLYQEMEPEKPSGDLPALGWRARIHVVEATQHVLDELTIDGEDVLARLGENHYEELDPDGDGELFTATRDEVRDLGRRPTAALHEWARDKPLNAWAFKDQRNEAVVDLPHPSAI